MDIDHSGRYLAQKFYKIRDPDYYEFEGTFCKQLNKQKLLTQIDILLYIAAVVVVADVIVVAIVNYVQCYFMSNWFDDQNEYSLS